MQAAESFTTTESWKWHLIPCTEFHQLRTPGLEQRGKRPHEDTKTRRQPSLGAILESGYHRLCVLLVTVSPECWVSD